MAWVLLVIAGLFETGFAAFLKESHGRTSFWPTVAFAACALISFGLLTIALKSLEVGPACAAWTASAPPAQPPSECSSWARTSPAVKLMSITFILVGVIGLNLAGVSPL